MTKIIDNIDVSGCKFFCEEYTEDSLDDGGVYDTDFCILGFNKCEKKSDCDYKKLQKAYARIKELENYISATKPTGICEICTEVSVSANDIYSRAIKKIMNVLNEGFTAGMNYDIEEITNDMLTELKELYDETTKRRNGNNTNESIEKSEE